MHYFSTAIIAALFTTGSAIVADWQQCGGTSYTGDTQCATSSGCVVLNPYYSQCQPGAAPVDPVPEQPPAPTTTSGPAATGTPAGSGPGKTLQSGYYWIRGVAAPNYHKYMQTKPLYAPGAALLGDYTTAGQFQVVDGQLVQLVSAPGEPVKLLYATVSPNKVINNASLAVTFTAEKNTYGAFKFGGDDLQWSAPGVSRPNPSAWYVCTGQQMYINLGNYAYQTPSGCADQTIHYYNDKTANNRRKRWL